jgi:copper(I)-binding protein
MIQTRQGQPRLGSFVSPHGDRAAGGHTVSADRGPSDRSRSSATDLAAPQSWSLTMKTLTLIAVSAAALASTAQAAPAAKVAATNAWCRPTVAGAMAAGCYVTLTAKGEDRLVAVETPAASRGEIHTMSMDGAVMRMRQLTDGLALPAGKTVALKPGADHIMLIAPKTPLKEGAKVPLTLKFKTAAPVTIEAVVKTPPMPGMAH